MLCCLGPCFSGLLSANSWAWQDTKTDTRLIDAAELWLEYSLKVLWKISFEVYYSLRPSSSPPYLLLLLPHFLPPVLQLLTQCSMKLVSHSCLYIPPLEKSWIRKFPLGPNLCQFWQGLAWGLGSEPGKFPPILYNASRLTLFFSSGVLNFSTRNLENKNSLIHPWLVQDTVLQELPNCSKEGLEPVHRPRLECTDKGTLICGLIPGCGCWGRGI